jgi:hypothetical protein
MRMGREKQREGREHVDCIIFLVVLCYMQVTDIGNGMDSRIPHEALARITTNRIKWKQ